MNRLMKDLAVDRARNPGGTLNDRWEAAEDDEEDDEDTDINLIDKSASADIHFFFTQFVIVKTGDDPWPGQYIDITRAQRVGDEGINWPRPS